MSKVLSDLLSRATVCQDGRPFIEGAPKLWLTALNESEGLRGLLRGESSQGDFRRSAIMNAASRGVQTDVTTLACEYFGDVFNRLLYFDLGKPLLSAQDDLSERYLLSTNLPTLYNDFEHKNVRSQPFSGIAHAVNFPTNLLSPDHVQTLLLFLQQSLREHQNNPEKLTLKVLASWNRPLLNHIYTLQGLQNLR